MPRYREQDLFEDVVGSTDCPWRGLVEFLILNYGLAETFEASWASFQEYQMGKVNQKDKQHDIPDGKGPQNEPQGTTKAGKRHTEKAGQTEKGTKRDHKGDAKKTEVNVDDTDLNTVWWAGAKLKCRFQTAIVELDEKININPSWATGMKYSLLLKAQQLVKSCCGTRSL